jgi:hypothetical protein
METADGRCSPDTWTRIHGELRRWDFLGLGLISVGLLLQGLSVLRLLVAVAPGRRAGPDPTSALLVFGGLSLYVAGLVAYARHKGRHPAWGALGLGCVFGLVVLRFLPRRCRGCGRLSPAARFECPACRAPL